MYIVLAIVVLLFFAAFQVIRIAAAITNIRESRRKKEKIDPSDVNVISFWVMIVVIVGYCIYRS